VSETIVIEFAADAESVVRAGAVAPGGAWLRDIAPDALSAEAGKEAVAVLDGAVVVLHRLQLPGFAAGKLLKILPGLMDERLAVTDGERHFALFDAPAAAPEEGEDAPAALPGDRLVAVTDAQALKSLLAHLRGLGLTPKAVVPDHMRLPVPARGMEAMQAGGRVCARRADGTGFTTEEATAALMLAPGTTVGQPGEEGWKRTLARAAEAETSLMQGAFAPRGNMAAGLVWFRRAAVLAAASVLLWAGGALYEAADNNSRADAYYAQAESAFRAALPDVPRIVNMEAQMRRAVLASRQQEGGEFGLGEFALGMAR
jgi:type II secretion system protein L